jgi:hypothetical protein
MHNFDIPDVSDVILNQINDKLTNIKTIYQEFCTDDTQYNLGIWQLITIAFKLSISTKFSRSLKDAIYEDSHQEMEEFFIYLNEVSHKKGVHLYFNLDMTIKEYIVGINNLSTGGCGFDHHIKPNITCVSLDEPEVYNLLDKFFDRMLDKTQRFIKAWRKGLNKISAYEVINDTKEVLKTMQQITIDYILAKDIEKYFIMDDPLMIELIDVRNTLFITKIKNNVLQSNREDEDVAFVCGKAHLIGKSGILNFCKTMNWKIDSVNLEIEGNKKDIIKKIRF